MSRRLALVLRGISYYDDLTRKVCNSPTIDYKECLNSFRNNLIAPLRSVFNQIDIFLITYVNPKLTDILTDYNPVDIKLYPSATIYNQNPREITAQLMSDSIDLVEKYSHLFYTNYNNIMITRFDMYYPIKFPTERLKLNSINFGWKGSYGQCDDCFHLFTPGHIPRIRAYIPRHNDDGYMHGLNHAFESEANYLSLRAPSDKEAYPDFYFFHRRLKDYQEGQMQLIEWSDRSWNWLVKEDAPRVGYTPEKHVAIITSCINPSNTPLSYSAVRSIFSPEERLTQTIESIQSIRSYLPDVVIVLVNNNFLTDREHTTLLSYCDHVFIFDSVCINDVLFTADLAKTFPNKSCTEVASLYYACQRIQQLKLEADYIWKLSGRYKLFPGFNRNKWLNTCITVPPRQPNGSINNILYSIPNHLLSYYMERLKICFTSCYNDLDSSKGCMVEHTLFEPDKVHFLAGKANIGGKCSHLESKLELIF